MKIAKFFIFTLLAASVTCVAYANTDTTASKPDETVLEKQFSEQYKASQIPISISLFKPTYVLPYYYTASPDFAVYNNNTPDNQKVMNSEFKAQFSLLVPIAYDLFGWKDSALEMAYTQLNFWQVYASSQYFRETNYEPEIFIQKLNHNWLMRAGVEHESNGRGGSYERSWNRAYLTGQLSGTDWLASLKVWALIFPAESVDLHNPDILYYLGRDQIVLAHKWGNVTLSIEAQNLESGLTRGYVEPTFSYQFAKHMSLYVQFFSGYGQSLIEYNHRTQAAGVGIAFNNWI